MSIQITKAQATLAIKLLSGVVPDVNYANSYAGLLTALYSIACPEVAQDNITVTGPVGMDLPEELVTNIKEIVREETRRGGILDRSG